VTVGHNGAGALTFAHGEHAEATLGEIDDPDAGHGHHRANPTSLKVSTSTSLSASTLG
jgi:hypothetical protein